MFAVIFAASLLKTIPVFMLKLYAFHEKLKFSNTLNAFFMLLYAVLISSASYCAIRFCDMKGFNAVIFSFFITALGTVTIALLLKKAFSYIFQIAFTVFLISGLIDSIAKTARMVQSNLNIHGVSMDISSGDFITSHGFSAIFFDGIIILTISPFIFLLIKYFLRPALQSTADMPFWRYLWLIPTTFFFMFRFVVYPTYYSEAPFSYQYSLWLCLVWILCTFIAHVLILKMLYQTACTLKLKKELELSELSMEMQKSHYHNIQVCLENLQMARQENRNELLLMQEYAKNHDFTSMEKLLQVNMGILDANVCRTYCENYSVNTLLWHFCRLCSENGITTETKINIPEDSFVSANDFCVLFGNLLENAFEACCRQSCGEKFMIVNADCPKPNFIALRVKNSFEGNPVKTVDGFLSSKRNEEGIGFKSVCSIVKKYDGTIKYTYDCGIFNVNVLLNSPRTHHRKRRLFRVPRIFPSGSNL